MHGRQEALTEVYHRHSGAMRAIARRALASADLAEEAVQDVFLALWVSPQRYDARRGSLRSYLQVQAYRRAIDIARSEASRHRREHHHSRRDRRPADDVERQVLDAASARQVHAAMAGLHPRQRQALELAYLGDDPPPSGGKPPLRASSRLTLPQGSLRTRSGRLPEGPRPDDS